MAEKSAKSSRSRKKVGASLKEKSFSFCEEDSMEESPKVDTVFEDVENIASTNEANESSRENKASMTEEEMAQHLKLCMKLSVENKINQKNAFGLRLIEIMQRIVKKEERADIQQASLSLQASSKIYAGRVDALYQDTLSFHGHLQSIMCGGKKEKKNKNAEDFMDDMDDDDDSSDKGKTKPQKNKCKSYLKPEESLEQDVSNLLTGEPHGNFVAINSAFSTSRLAPKLLSILQNVNDSCQLRCAVPNKCSQPVTSIENKAFGIPPKLEGIFEKIKNFDVSQARFQVLVSSNDSSRSLYATTPKPGPPPPLIFDDDDTRGGDFAFDVPCNDSPVREPSKNRDSIESTVEQFDVLNITVDAFINDMSAAVTSKGFDEKRLPPNSALKKAVDSSRKSSVKPTVGKSTKRKAREPFFEGKSISDVKHLFVKGRAINVSQKVLSEWSIEDTTNIDFCYKFIEEFENRRDRDPDYIPNLDQVLEVIKQNDLQYNFKSYFNKHSQMWKFSRRKFCLDDSFSGAHLNNETERRLGSLGGAALGEPEKLALSFQNLSIVDEGDDAAPDIGADDFELPDVAEIDDQQFGDSPGLFENDIDELMVKPPELVRPASMKFDKKPMNFDTDKIKHLLWKIISRRLEVNDGSDETTKFALFSDVYQDLKLKLEREVSESISMQFTFVVLLILANQKTLLIENVKENTDLSIKRDISEIDVSEST